MINTRICLLFFSTALLISSCVQERRDDVDISGVKISQPFLRFERDLFSFGDTVTVENVKTLSAKYGSFFDLYCMRMIRIRYDNDSLAAIDLTHFINDADVKVIYAKTDSAFKNSDEIEKKCNDAFKHYAHYFPSKPIPQIVTYISAFNYQVITADSILGIGLDMYLGEQNELMYASIGIPKYMYARFTKEYILSDAIKRWFESEYDGGKVKQELLSQMIYQGKNLYATGALMPALPDTIKMGYSKNQLDWCVKNESNIWAFLIEQKLLYNTVIQEYVKYINDGPSTNGLPKESPSKIGAWIGWQIVKAYMNKNPDVTLAQLMEINDAQKILNDSGYKPKK